MGTVRIYVGESEFRRSNRDFCILQELRVPLGDVREAEDGSETKCVLRRAEGAFYSTEMIYDSEMEDAVQRFLERVDSFWSIEIAYREKCTGVIPDLVVFLRDQNHKKHIKLFCIDAHRLQLPEDVVEMVDRIVLCGDEYLKGRALDAAGFSAADKVVFVDGATLKAHADDK